MPPSWCRQAEERLKLARDEFWVNHISGYEHELTPRMPRDKAFAKVRWGLMIERRRVPHNECRLAHEE